MPINPDGWRQGAIDVLNALPELTGEALDKAIFDAYPFGCREYTPYRIWLEEVKRFKVRRMNPNQKRDYERALLKSEMEKRYGAKP